MVLVIAASVVGDVVWALNAPLSSPVANTRSLTAPATQPAAFALPTDGATAVTVTGAPDYLGAGGVHLTAGDESPRPIASISKVITVLVVLDALATMLIPSASNDADGIDVAVRFAPRLPHLVGHPDRDLDRHHQPDRVPRRRAGRHRRVDGGPGDRERRAARARNPRSAHRLVAPHPPRAAAGLTGAIAPPSPRAQRLPLDLERGGIGRRHTRG
ncbi:hypothetical protein G3N30_09930 [Microbacterium lacticum]|uniref:hypothetical protein n=1 Tax=Microbacterium lacticum TaxID=33885 RepID=UPI0018B0C944|nr:hypothetical protein [Microbacterium lacticum]MBF9336523.1 hypothetical protein [Microbacterium lacticum]